MNNYPNKRSPALHISCKRQKHDRHVSHIILKLHVDIPQTHTHMHTHDNNAVFLRCPKQKEAKDRKQRSEMGLEGKRGAKKLLGE